MRQSPYHVDEALKYLLFATLGRPPHWELYFNYTLYQWLLKSYKLIQKLI